jgi:hypothetical protein
LTLRDANLHVLKREDAAELLNVSPRLVARRDCGEVGCANLHTHLRLLKNRSANLRNGEYAARRENRLATFGKFAEG